MMLDTFFVGLFGVALVTLYLDDSFPWLLDALLTPLHVPAKVTLSCPPIGSLTRCWVAPDGSCYAVVSPAPVPRNPPTTIMPNLERSDSMSPRDDLFGPMTCGPLDTSSRRDGEVC